MQGRQTDCRLYHNSRLSGWNGLPLNVASVYLVCGDRADQMASHIQGAHADRQSNGKSGREKYCEANRLRMRRAVSPLTNDPKMYSVIPELPK